LRGEISKAWLLAGWTTFYHDKEVTVTKALKTVALLAVTASLGCVTLPVAATVVTQPGRRVTAEASKFNIFGVTPLPVETAGLLLDDLLEQCDGADLTGVTVGTETGFAVIGQTEKVVVSGYCVEPGRSDRNDGGALP